MKHKFKTDRGTQGPGRGGIYAARRPGEHGRAVLRGGRGARAGARVGLFIGYPGGFWKWLKNRRCPNICCWLGDSPC